IRGRNVTGVQTCALPISLLTLSTEALDLTDAIEFFLKPLKIFKFPIHEMTLMLALALRFIPTMVDEAEVIMNAQRARGVSFNKRSEERRVGKECVSDS